MPKNSRRIKNLTLFFVISLILSGITAFPAETELNFLIKYTHFLPDFMSDFLKNIQLALIETNQKYPMLAYGYDWLAFAHIVIAISFYGVWKDPVKNIWTVEFCMIACVLIIPLAFICGPIRHIPIWWTLIDCSFGVFGIIPLYYLRKWIIELKHSPQ